MIIFQFIWKIIHNTLASLGMFVVSLVIACLFTTIPNDLFKMLEVKPVFNKADVIVVLGAGVTQDGWPDRFSLERAVKGVILYKQGYASKIIFSGGWDHDGYISSSKAMAAVAIDLGVPLKDIIVEDISHDTHENAENTVAIMKRLQMNSAVLVTSDSHMRRAALVFTKLNMPVSPVPVEEELLKPELSWRSKIHNFSIIYQVLYESAASWKYKSRGWL